MARIFITGSSQGIGTECGRQLVALGHEVVLHGRDEARSAAALSAVPDAAAAVSGDLASFAGTRAVADQANALGPFDAVIHNAGIGGGVPERTVTEDGLELIFQVNAVAPYMLTCLMPVAPRMVYLTSGLEERGRWHPDDLQWTRRAWNGMQAYSDSKLHVSMLSFELAERHPEAAINVVDPGWIQTRMGGPEAWDPVDLGAETQVWLATSDDNPATASGRYLKRRGTLAPNPTVLDGHARGALITELERLTSLTLP